jgi:hypothetical protein
VSKRVWRGVNPLDILAVLVSRFLSKLTLFSIGGTILVFLLILYAIASLLRQ